MDTDSNLFLVEENARRIPLLAGGKREAVTDGRTRLVEMDQDESLVEDQRETLRPAQHVERKLVAMLHTSAVLVSQLQKVTKPHGR